MKTIFKESKKDFNIVIDDTANLDKTYQETNRAIKLILFFSSPKNKYKVMFYTNTFMNNIQGKKFFGTIEKNGIHLSRLYPSKLKQKAYLNCFVGTDLQGNKDTLFFNMDLDKGLLTIKRKVTAVSL